MASTSVVFDILARDHASAKFDALGRSADGAQTKMGKFTGFMKTAGKAAAYGLGAGIVAGSAALVGMTKNAVEDEAAQRKLAVALLNSVGATDEQTAAVERWISAQGVALGVTDDELRPAFQRLVEATGSIEEAQRQMAIAMDVSAGTGKSLKTVSEALMKANNGTTASLSKLGLKTKDVDGTVLSLDQALMKMSDTFEGQAAAKASTLDGKMGRLKLILDETKETIGAKLIPVVTQLADWILTKAVPAVDQFTKEWKKGVGTGGQVRDVLDKIKNALVGTTKFLAQHKEAVAVVVGAYLTFKATTLAIAAAQKVAAAAVGIYTVATKVAAAATKVWAAGQWLLNAALTANPIGLVVVGVAALAAGIFIAYKKSETFRAGVSKLWDWLRKFIGMSPLGSIISNFQSAWSFASNLVEKIKELVSWIGRLDLGKVKDIAGAIPGLGGLLPRSAIGSQGKSAGDAWMDGFQKGAEQRRGQWLKFLGGLMRDQLDAARSAIADMRDRRNSFADFSGFRGNLFGADISGGPEGTGPTGIAALRAFAAAERLKAEQLAADVAKLTDMGISQDLLEDLKSQGASGLAQIHALASASQAEANEIFANMAAAAALNARAGQDAASRLDEQLGTMGATIAAMARSLTAVVGAPPVVNIQVDLEGRTIVKTVKAEERATGHQYFVRI